MKQSKRKEVTIQLPNALASIKIFKKIPKNMFLWHWLK